MTDHNDKHSGAQHLQPVPAAQANRQMAVYNPNQQMMEDDDTIDLLEYWRILVKRRWTVAGVVAIVVVAAFLSTLLMVPEYRSTAQLQILPQGQRILAYDDFAGDGAAAGRGFQEFFATQAQILQSRSLAERVVERHGLANHPELTGEIRQRSVASELRSIVGVVRGAFRPSEPASRAEGDPARRAANRLRERIDISPVRNSQLINVSVSAFDPAFAAQLTNALVEEYIRANLERRLDAGGDARDFLETQLADMRIALERSDEALMDFARESNIADLDDRLERTRSAGRRLADQLSEVQAELVQLGTWRELIEQGRIDALDPVVNSPVIADLERRLLDANTEYTSLSATFQDEFPRVQEVLQRIERLRAEIASTRQQLAQGIVDRYEALQAQEAALERAVEAREDDLLALNERAVQYNILRREFETSRELYDGLLQRMKEIGVASGVQENNVSVIDRAQAAAFPFKPNLPRNLALALVLGLMGGVGLALLLEFLDGSIRRVEDIERLVDRPVLGLVPLVRVKGQDGRTISRKKAAHRKLEDSIAHYSADKPASSVSEAFRSLRTSLGFSTAEGMPNLLMVTSASMGEGKTTVAINLATVLAQNGARVLIVDADLRKPRVHREFHNVRAPGLTNRIAMYENSGKDSSAIYPTRINNLFIMPAGNSTPNPAEMLSSERLAKVLKGCVRAFDHVIVDAPPVLGLADALILSRQTQGVVFVARAGETGKDNFRVCMKRLAQVHAPVLGVVLNGVDLDSPEYAYYSSYYYNYESDADEPALAHDRPDQQASGSAH